MNGEREGPLARYEDFNGKCVPREPRDGDAKDKDDKQQMENYSQCKDELGLCKRFLLTAEGSRS